MILMIFNSNQIFHVKTIEFEGICPGKLNIDSELVHIFETF